MAVYSVSDIDVHDWDTYDEYMRQVSPIIKKFGGRYLVRGGEIKSTAGDWSFSRIVILEFPSQEDMDKFRNSSEYAPVAELRHKAAKTRSFVVEGYDG